jgi:hypothetical protein
MEKSHPHLRIEREEPVTEKRPGRPPVPELPADPIAHGSSLWQRLAGKLLSKQKHEGKRAVTEVDRRRWQLPKETWQDWEVPFDTDPD